METRTFSNVIDILEAGEVRYGAYQRLAHVFKDAPFHNPVHQLDLRELAAARRELMELGWKEINGRMAIPFNLVHAGAWVQKKALDAQGLTPDILRACVIQAAHDETIRRP